jgi:hypothetical protein
VLVVQIYNLLVCAKHFLKKSIRIFCNQKTIMILTIDVGNTELKVLF